MIAGQPLSLSAILPNGISPSDFYVMLSGLLAFATVFMVGNNYTIRHNFAPRIKAIQERRLQLKNNLLAAPRRKKAEESSLTFMRKILARLRLLRKYQTSKLSILLTSAGYRSHDALVIFLSSKLVCPVIGLILSILIHNISAQTPFSEIWHYAIPIFGIIAGFYAPDILISNTRNKRWYTIQRSLADTLDLMLICAEAGLSLSATLDRVSRELGDAYPEMAEELGMTSAELGFLPERRKALEGLVARVNLPEIRGIVGVLIQTEKYGTPIAQALRVLSAEFRTQRMLRAEQKAARLPVLMTLPMIIFILPTLFIVVLAPAIVQLLLTI